jgi:CelD/BcsL family acetyltransferase involved in cellulose biosynthesis
MKAEVLTEIDAIAGIEDEWRDLAVARGSAFTSPEWARAWWAAGGGGEPAIAVVRRADGDVAGVIAMARERGRGGALRFPGAALGDRFVPAAAPADEAEVAAAAFSAFDDAGIAAPMTILHRVDADGDWPTAVAERPGRRRAVIEQSPAELLYISTADLDWDGYLATRSQKFRQRVARGLDKALAKEHSYEVRESDASTLEADLATLFRLHDLRHAETSSIAADRDRAFIAEFSRRAAAAGWLRLRLLEIEGEPVAAFLGWRIGGRYAIYQSGFDPAWQRFSVGALLLVHTVRAGIEEGAEEVDMLLGEEAYKQRFAAATRTVHTVTIAPRWSGARMLVAAEAAGRKRARGLADHPRVGEALKRVARLLPTGRRD